MRRSQSPPCAHFVWSHELPPPLKGANGVAELPWWSRTLYGLRVGATTPAGAACDVTATGVASTGGWSCQWGRTRSACAIRSLGFKAWAYVFTMCVSVGFARRMWLSPPCAHLAWTPELTAAEPPPLNSAKGVQPPAWRSQLTDCMTG